MRPTITPERQAIHEQIQTVLAGHPVEPALAGLTDSLSAMIAFVADDLEEAFTLLDRLVPDMKSAMRENWDLTREARAMVGGPWGQQ